MNKIFKQYYNYKIKNETINKYLIYFEESNIKVKNIYLVINESSSDTYIIDTQKKTYALYISNEKEVDILNDKYRIYKRNKYTTNVYDCRIIENKLCFVMEALIPLSQYEKDILRTIDYILFINGDERLDIYLSYNDNLYENLSHILENLSHERLFQLTKRNQYCKKILYMKDNLEYCKDDIVKIENIFINYKKTSKNSFSNFQSEKIMKNLNNDFKIIGF